MSACVDIVGLRFNRLVVKQRSGTYVSPAGAKHAQWECLCDCGNTIFVTTGKLRSGNTQSCGCLQRERTSRASRTHGESRTRLYQIWKGMKARCHNRNYTQYKDYGGRGITICDVWQQNYEAFRRWAAESGYAHNLTIDRIDVNGDYCPENCRWITLREQQDNRRNTVRITTGDVTHTAKEWAEVTGIPYNTVRGRFYRGYSPQDILSTKKIAWGTYGE